MDYSRLPTSNANGDIYVVIECPRGSTIKLKFDHELSVLTLSRPLPLGVQYPYDWGFVPSARAEDGDPLDALVIWDGASYPGVVLACRLLGVLEVEQNSKEHPEVRERNDRLIGVPVNAPRHDGISSVDDLSARIKGEIEEFFAAAATFENKELVFRGWRDPISAYELVRRSVATARHANE